MSIGDTTSIVLKPSGKNFCKRLSDPYDSSLFHMESLLPLNQVVKLIHSGPVGYLENKNDELRILLEEARERPKTFHLKTNGITYQCSTFRYDNITNRLILTIHHDKKYGITDGLHIFNLIKEICELPLTEMPFIRVRFFAKTCSVQNQTQLNLSQNDIESLKKLIMQLKLDK